MRDPFKRHQAALRGSVFARPERQTGIKLQHQPVKTAPIRNMGRADQESPANALFRKSLHGACKPAIRFHRRDLKFGLVELP